VNPKQATLPGTCRQPPGATPDPDLCSVYCSDHPFVTTCDKCGKDITVTYGRLEVIGAYCSGCLGYPACHCRVAHTGDCP
jgi:hypothetical protein